MTWPRLEWKKKKGPVTSDAAIMKLDGELEWKTTETKVYQEEKNCMASQGGHSSAQYYNAL